MLGYISLDVLKIVCQNFNRSFIEEWHRQNDHKHPPWEGNGKDNRPLMTWIRQCLKKHYQHNELTTQRAWDILYRLVEADVFVAPHGYAFQDRWREQPVGGADVVSLGAAVEYQRSRALELLIAQCGYFDRCGVFKNDRGDLLPQSRPSAHSTYGPVGFHWQATTIGRWSLRRTEISRRTAAPPLGPSMIGATAVSVGAAPCSASAPLLGTSSTTQNIALPHATIVSSPVGGGSASIPVPGVPAVSSPLVHVCGGVAVVPAASPPAVLVYEIK